MNASAFSLVLAALVAANLPFVFQRLFFVWPLKHGKSWTWHVLELLIAYVVVGCLGLATEQHQGQIHPQGWEFYAVTLAMFLTLAFPGFVYRYLLHKR